MTYEQLKAIQPPCTASSLNRAACALTRAHWLSWEAKEFKTGDGLRMKSQQTVSSGEVKVADVKGVRATREVALTAVLSARADLREGILVETQ